MKRRHQVVLFAVLLLSLTILSPSFDFRGSQHNQERNQENDTYPGTLSRNDDTSAPLNVTVAMSKEEFTAFEKLAKEVAASRYVEVNLRNVEPGDYDDVLDQEFSLGENGDIILLENDQVQLYAKKGYLLPLNGTQLSKSMGETVAELRAMTEWNGYEWGIPFDFDPYVMGARASFLHKAGLQAFPNNKEQWSKLVQEAQAEGTALISLGKDDIVGASVWMGYLTPGMSPDQVLRLQSASPTGELQRGISLLNELQPYITMMSALPVNFASNDKAHTPLFVTTLSRILYTDEASPDVEILRPSVSLEPLQAVRSRSLVITAGSVETDAASRWIEGMRSATVQNKWHVQAKRFSARQHEQNQQATQVQARYKILLKPFWFTKDDNPVRAAERQAMLIRFQKQVRQLLQGDISAAQYVNSIRKAATP
ncbi:carbohydrate ABC transporter substrate-binding protein [Paenibacillus barcinonensis]|uniref:ABC-type glycerol-3-phosphate transport system substrate-binding protein n=1 Tax=Paenibacillus barcinonensis TaxID=198119 RepID=A0A2V4WDU5_PAEBA|nr:ABC transporter substrate-binding protein [Paenibacillus barcinonensis]PYE45764.1 ABC-type glycerol-3-phosphate transport system substrate-binding protein [Paenibacillus barcinonensis]QKS56331.1 carbohydrate ABC transporter substrate-binding protein [Paenibacillus barcinonensis]